MKTMELKWIEDDNHVVAEDAYNGLKELIDTGVFKTLSTECKDDVLYITGEQDELDKAVMKIQKAYAKYGQIMIKEAKKEGGLRIESYDDNVQEIFDYTVKEFNKLKENKYSEDYITKLGDLQIKFMRLKEAAGRKDKATIQNYLDEISTLTENAEIKKIKPIRMKVNEEKIVSDELSYNEALRKQLSNPANWGIIGENMNRKQYNDKYDRVALAYARETGMDLDDAYDELMDVDELVNWIEGPYNVKEIIQKLLYESTDMNESFLSPGEMKKKLQRVSARWASIQGIRFEDAYNELRRKKSVKDMLDFYTVDEIIDDLNKQKNKEIKEEDDELEEEI